MFINTYWLFKPKAHFYEMLLIYILTSFLCGYWCVQPD